MVSCDICGKKFKNTQGLRGHKNFVHSDKVGNAGQIVAQQATQQQLSSKLSTPVTTEQRLSQLEKRFEKLEYITGVRETNEPDKLLGITDIPLTGQVSQLTEQFSKLAEQLKTEYVSTEVMETKLYREYKSLHKEIADTYNTLVNAIRETRALCENIFSKTKRSMIKPLHI